MEVVNDGGVDVDAGGRGLERRMWTAAGKEIHERIWVSADAAAVSAAASAAGVAAPTAAGAKVVVFEHIDNPIVTGSVVNIAEPAAGGAAAKVTYGLRWARRADAPAGAPPPIPPPGDPQAAVAAAVRHLKTMAEGGGGGAA